MKVKIKDIVIGERQRIEIGDLSDLSSMGEEEVGQILPIVLDEGNLLVDGRRRLAKAEQLGWTEIEAHYKGKITEIQKQKMEFLADVGRKDRTWQERCLAIAKIHNMMKREKALEGETWTIRAMELFSGISRNVIQNHLAVAKALQVLPRDEEVWACENLYSAFKLVAVDRALKLAQAELERRREEIVVNFEKATEPVPNQDITEGTAQTAIPNVVKDAYWSLQERAARFNAEHPSILPLVVGESNGREFLHGFWFCFGGNISDFYGAYQIEYLKRVESLFADITGKQNVVHLFAGSLPPSPNYTVVGLPDAHYTPDFVCDAEKLSSYLPFKPMLIYADPPYSIEDSEHYANAMVNRAKVLEECALVLKPGGYIVWLDQALPIFSNDQLRYIGGIGYIRSTGNRFRLVSIFQKI